MRLSRAIRVGTAALLSGALLAACGGQPASPSTSSTSASTSTSSLVSKAKAEGKVTILGFPVQSLGDGLRRQIAKKYGIQVEYTHTTENAGYTREATEEQAGHVTTDISLNSQSTTRLLAKKGWLAPLPRAAMAPFASKWRDPNGKWVTFELLPFGILYNKKLISASEAPSSLQALLNPRWKGHIAMSDPHQIYIYLRLFKSWLQEMGPAKGEQFLKGLEANKPIYFANPSAVSVALNQGQAEVAISNPVHVLSIGGKNGNLAAVRTNPTYGETATLAIMKHAPHPYAARLVASYMLSKPFMTFVARKLGYPVTYPGIESVLPSLQGNIGMRRAYQFSSPAAANAFWKKTIKPIFGR